MATEPPTTTPPPPAPPAPPASLPEPPGWPRWINTALGAWLFVSTFLWPHSAGSATNSWIVGLLIVAVSLVALNLPWIRWFNTALALWLFFSTLAVPPASRATLWNNLIVGILVFLASLVPGALFPRPRPPRDLESG